MESPRERPHGAWLALLVAIMVGPPIAHRLGAPGVGSFSMFTDIREFRVLLRTGAPPLPPRQLPMSILAPHLGRDARRLLTGAGRFVLGETQIDLLAAGGLADLTELACALRPDAARAEAVLEVRRPGHREVAVTRLVEECERSR